MRSATGLRTFGTQLKILCSVKAASIETNKDNDESLASLTRNLGEVPSFPLLVTSLPTREANDDQSQG